MRNNLVQSLFLVTLPVVLLTGCAHSARQEADHYSLAPGAQLTPTSRPDAGAYAGDSGNYNSLPPATTAEPTSAGDAVLADNLRRALIAEQSLNPYASGVSVVVDKSNKGLVTLRGAVPSEEVRQQLHQRIAAVPGVNQIDDQLVVGVPPEPGFEQAR